MNTKLFAAVSVMLLCLTCFAVAVSDGSDAARGTGAVGSSSNPASSLSGTAYSLYNTTSYVKVGGSVSIGYDDSSDFPYLYECFSISSNIGLTASSGTVSGTVTGTGTATITGHIINVEYSQIEDSFSITIVGVSAGPSYSVSFSSNGGSNSPSPQTVQSGSSITLPSPGSRSNYTFNGWYTASSGGSYVGGVGSSYTVTSSKTLYAQWTYVAPSQYYYAYLYFNANGGSGAPAVMSDSMYGTSASGSASFSIPSAVPTKSGSTFLGWANYSGATTPLYTSGSTVYVPYGSSSTVYAVWSQNSIDITSSQGNATMIIGDSFSYTVGTNVSGCSLSVSGASWLSVSGGKIVGTPSSPGTYSVTITASKTGYTPDSQTFSITVAARLGFTSAPTGSILVSAA